MSHLDLTGHKYGRLQIIKYSGRDKNNLPEWMCECDCGVVKTYKAYLLRCGRIKSCGCLRREMMTKHGMHKHPSYVSWNAMMSRCYLPGTNSYEIYGGRGITVCDRWHKFENFYDDMGDRPKSFQIDRIDSDGNYEHGNCGWASATDNARNRHSTKLNTEAVKVIKYALKNMDISQGKLAKIYGVTQTLISAINTNKIWKEVSI